MRLRKTLKFSCDAARAGHDPALIEGYLMDMSDGHIQTRLEMRGGSNSRALSHVPARPAVHSERIALHA